MKRFLLLCIAIAFSAVGYAQTNKEYSLAEIRSSDELEYDIYTYNLDFLLEGTDILFEDGTELKNALTYDASNNIIKLDNYQLINGTWTYVSYIEYTYDGNGNRLSRSNYNSFGGTTFTLGGIYNYFYDNNVRTNWNLYLNGTDLVALGTLTYNAEGKIIEEFSQDIWNSGTMEDSWKIDYQYNTDGTLKTLAQSFWDGASWYSPSAEWFYYDANKNCITWEQKSGSRVTNRNEYEYDLNYTIDQLVLPIKPEADSDKESLVEMKNKVTLKHWYTEDDQGNLVYVCDYIYTYDLLGTVGIPDHGLNAVNMLVYPNPTSDFITITANNTLLRNIDILDTAGKLVLKESNLNKSETSMDVSGLQSGVYYVKLSTSNGIDTKKLVVK
ncbi:hypothetical protein Aeqsu_0163 [Aequorivita sublithincola DSM 14238]|uniref:Secretion system C-terminal sorting domain-containing protein n=1 Tax=Aequorivita sublithincola (strain DSM 14238 / LMG 21431 / ACAM 643 / 9-3) TaxID=746697 RepID=I3YRS3_AEQSU|nr:T9SS type A sorting domain-containing protein [Aequorivita sublithincola]AFL79691.1 hypothetical protein Aeqsu_0163 [Aequorivita sublithincola DSM 14238]